MYGDFFLMNQSFHFFDVFLAFRGSSFRTHFISQTSFALLAYHKGLSLFQLENELHTAQQRIAQVTEDKNRIEDRLSAVEAAHCLAQDQANQLQVGQKINLL